MFTVYCPWRGIVAPLILAAVGVACIVTETAWIRGRGTTLVLHGVPGIVMGLMFISWALGLHLRHVWIAVKAFATTAHLLGLLAYIAAVAFALYLLWLLITETLL